MSTLRANTLKPITSGNSLVLQGDSGGSGVSGPSIDSNGDVDFSQNTNAKVKLPSGGGIYESDGSTEILTESSGAVSLKNTAIDSSVTMSANQSAVKTALNASGSAPIYACRAWVNFNGTGTVAIRDSGNVSSITDNGSGDYTVNYTTAMPDANYCAVLGAVNRSSGSSLTQTTNLHSTNATNVNDYLAGSVRIGAAKTSNIGTYNDIDTVNVAIFR